MTEELWHALPHDGDALTIAPWPSPDEADRDPEVEIALGLVFESVRALRNLRAENRHPPAERLVAVVVPSGEPEARLYEAESATIVRLAKLARIDVLPPGTPRPARHASRVVPAGELFVPLPSDGAQATESLTRERDRLTELLGKTRARLADPTFRSRAPPQVVAEAEEKARELEERVGRLDRHLTDAQTPEAGG